MHVVPVRAVTFLGRMFKLKKYNNVVEATWWAMFMRKLFGSAVVQIISHQDSSGCRIERKFTPAGFLFFCIWSSIFIYCSVIAQIYDQTILRGIYQTRLQRYGDDFERFTSTIYVGVIMIIIPFQISGNKFLVQNIVDIDKTINNTGDSLNYNKTAVKFIVISVAEVFVCALRMLCIWICLRNNVDFPSEKMFQVIYSEGQAIILTSIFLFYIVGVRDRYRWIAKVLKELKNRNCWEHKMYICNSIDINSGKFSHKKDKLVREKIRTCAKVYGSLYQTVFSINRSFGLALFMTMFKCLNYIILYCFYFMEATATGLFHNADAYINFLVYGFWEVALAFGVILLIVYYSETTVKEANNLSSIVHEIINEDLSPSITMEAMQFSTQLLHEKPVFMVMGFYDLDYSLILQGAKTVTTYLIILLQFVTDNKDNEELTLLK